jgi:glycosyltransferase involved in cell wall biosynthesis
MAEPSVLVGIVTKNRAGLLPKSISSALAQADVQLSVSVIDDGSTDATSTLAPKFPTVDWIRWATSRGYLAARNHWLESTKADYVASLDDDAWFLKGDEISCALRYLESNTSIAAVAFDILSPDRPQVVPRSDPQRAAHFIGCGHVLRVSAARQVGCYEAVPGGYGVEEKDLALRLLDVGMEVVRMPGVHVWHEKSAIGRDIAAQHESGVCNDLTMAVRRTPLLLLPLALASKVWKHAAFAAQHGLLKPCLAGMVLFVRSVPRIWSSRQPVKASTLRRFMKLQAR